MPKLVKPMRSPPARGGRSKLAAASLPAAAKLPRSNARGALRREALLAVAQEVFLERGYAGTSVEDVVGRVGGSKASLYSYFGSKEGLFADMIQSRCAEFLKAVAVPQAVDGTLESTLVAFGLRFFRVFSHKERVQVSRAIIAEATRFPELAALLYQSGPRHIRMQLASFFADCHAKGLMHAPDPELAAIFFIELVKGHCQFRCLLGLSPIAGSRTQADFVAAAVQVFLRGHSLPEGVST